MARVDGVSVDLGAVETNLVNIDVGVPAAEVAAEARGLGVLISASGPRRLRAVTHLDVPAAAIDGAAEVLERSIYLVTRRTEGTP